MKAGFLPRLLSLVFLAATVRAADTFEDAMEHATLDYTQRLQSASDELIQTRERISKEKAPLLHAMRAAEDRIITAEQETTRLETAQDQSQENRRRILKEADSLRRNESYVTTLAHDGLKAYGDGLAPGEGQLLSDRVQELQQNLEDQARS
jgi:hypothetical protein